MRRNLIECSPQGVAELLREINQLRSALHHAVYRNHPPAPKACSACEQIQNFLMELESMGVGTQKGRR